MTQTAFRFRTRTSVSSAAPPKAVYAVVSDLEQHLVRSGERAEDPAFKMSSIEAPNAPARAYGKQLSNLARLAEERVDT